MDLVRGKQIVIFQLLIVLTVSVGNVKSAAPDNITYTCGESGVTGLQKISDIHKIVIVSTGSDPGQFCRPTDAALSSCDTIKNKKHLIVIYDEESNNIIDHDSKYYDLKCADNPSVVGMKATVFTVNSQTKTQVNETVNIKHVFELKLKTGSGDIQAGKAINIGDELKLQMTGNGVVVSPLNCTAYPKGERNEMITIWEFNNKNGKAECLNNHTSIISGTQWKKLKTDGHDIEIVLYAFRFVSSLEVQIECFARVCSVDNPGDCSEACITPAAKRRRRRDVSKGENKATYLRSSSISFAIRKNQDRVNSSPGLAIGFTKFLLIALTLVHVYSA